LMQPTLFCNFTIFTFIEIPNELGSWDEKIGKD